VVVVGAGPSGLTASYALCRNNVVPRIFERSDRVGGLMQSHARPPYILDLGRKELYSRIPEIDALWKAILGEDYRPYPHRVGSLHQGKIFELSKEHRGILRGVPATLLVRGLASLIRGRMAGLARKPQNYEEHWHSKFGAVFAELFAQGYWEKFRGVRWADMPQPGPNDAKSSTGFSRNAIISALRGETGGKGRTDAVATWRHPRLGCGQLYDRLHEEIAHYGGHIEFDTVVHRMTLLDDQRWRIDFSRGEQCASETADYVVSSLSLEALTSVLYRGNTPLLCASDAHVPPDLPLVERRHVLIVYLFFDGAPLFSHAWLEVNDRNLQCGRITNFSAFGGDMVPPGKTCLCVEFFLSEADALFSESDSAITRLAINECAQASLIDPKAVEDTCVIRLARTNAASSWRELQSQERADVLVQLGGLESFFHVNRPGSDWASFAGLLAGEAIVSGSRAHFDRLADPLKRLSG
jgi:protoporphyrinogen oxidase